MAGPLPTLPAFREENKKKTGPPFFFCGFLDADAWRREKKRGEGPLSEEKEEREEGSLCSFLGPGGLAHLPCLSRGYKGTGENQYESGGGGKKRRASPESFFLNDRLSLPVGAGPGKRRKKGGEEA